MTGNSEFTFRKQIRGLLDENIDRYPDAVRWMMEIVRDVDLDAIETDYERFVNELSSEYTWSGHPFNPNPISGQSDKFVHLIKFIRNKDGIGLKEAKKKAEEFICNSYPQSKRAKNLRDYDML